MPTLELKIQRTKVFALAGKIVMLAWWKFNGISLKEVVEKSVEESLMVAPLKQLKLVVLQADVSQLIITKPHLIMKPLLNSGRSSGRRIDHY